MTTLIDIVEIDVERCHLTYGEGLCQAALGVSGDRKCYNSLGTCQDRVNFDAASAGTPAVPAGIGGYQGHYGSTSGTTSVHTIAGIDFGAVAIAGSEREIVLAISVQGSPTLSGVTIGGVTATIDASRAVSTTSRVYLARAAVPAGTSGSAVLTFNANLAQTALRVGAFRLIDVDGVADSDGVNGVNTSGPTTVSLSLDVPANSYVIAAATTVFLFGVTTMTGVTRRYSQSISSGVAYATAGSETVVEADDTFVITASAIEDAPINLIAVAYKLHNYEPPVTAEPEGNLATWRFAKPTDDLAQSGIDAIPSIEAISFTPSLIEPGEGLGNRPVIKVTFREHRTADTGPNGDKYLADRAFDPAVTGTFWAKFRARNPYLRNRVLRWRQGPLGAGLDAFETRAFYIDSFEGPTPDGRFTITARDPMQALFSDRSECPLPSTGQLAAGITASDTSAALVPAGIGDAEYPEDGWLNFSGTEIVGFSRTGDVLNLTGGRGLWGTEAVDHDAGARVQVCAAFIADDPADALYRVMTEDDDVPTSAITLADWQDETAAFYQGGLLTALIGEPTPRETLAEEIIKETGLSVWWDDLAGRVRLQVLRPIDTDALVLDDRLAPGEGNVLAGSTNIMDQPERRKSRAIVYYGQRSPLASNDEENLPSSVVQIDARQEKDEGSKSRDIIYSRWIPSGGLGAAQAVAARRLSRYARAPRKISCEVPRWGTLQPALGQGVLFQTETHQDDQGFPETVPCQVVSVSPGARGGAAYGLVLEELRFDAQFVPEIPPNTVVLAVSELNVNFRTKFLQLFADLEPGDTATLIINEGVAIGSRAIELPALDIGAWPAGINIALIDRGTISGKGGDGAKGRGGDNNAGYDGQNGGLALKTTVPITLSGTGRIQGGGGGGGGGAGDYAGWTGPQRDGGGGGGGAGWPPGAGGTAGGTAEAGQPGTLLAGGAGGRGRSGSGLSNSQHKGGNGGAPGATGGDANGYSPGDGGNPGVAVDGWSLINTTDWTGTVAGATIN